MGMGIWKYAMLESVESYVGCVIDFGEVHNGGGEIPSHNKENFE